MSSLPFNYFQFSFYTILAFEEPETLRCPLCAELQSVLLTICLINNVHILLVNMYTICVYTVKFNARVVSLYLICNSVPIRSNNAIVHDCFCSITLYSFRCKSNWLDCSLKLGIASFAYSFLRHTYLSRNPEISLTRLLNLIANL